MSTDSTRDRILDAAETLFAEKGIASTSLRELTAAAGANLAAVHYHFGSKDALVHEVFRRRLEPINRERLRLLEEAEAAAGDRPLAIEEVIRAFLAPAFEVFPNQEACLTLMGRLHLHPHEEISRLVLDDMREVIQRFVAAFQRSCPELSRADVLTRGHFMIGALVHTLTSWRMLTMLEPRLVEVSAPTGFLDDLVAFVAAGFAAPLPSPTSQA